MNRDELAAAGWTPVRMAAHGWTDLTAGELAAARIALGLSQNQLAHRLGVAQSTLSRWEAGRLPIERPRMLALALAQLADVEARGTAVPDPSRAPRAAAP